MTLREPADRTEPSAPDGSQRVRDDSDSLLDALNDLKSTELRKRQEDISTPPFHELAEEVEDKSREVFQIAAEQTRDGNRVRTSDVSVNEVAPSKPDPGG